MKSSREIELSRRALLMGGAASVAATTLPVARADAQTRVQAPRPDTQAILAKVSFEVNGTARALELDTRTS